MPIDMPPSTPGFHIEQYNPPASPPVGNVFIPSVLQESEKEPLPAKPVAKPSSTVKSRYAIVIPYEVINDKPVWGHQSAWSRAWEAPIRVNGMRLVTDMGDYNDHKAVDAALKNPENNLDAFTEIEDRLGASSVIILKLSDQKLDINIIEPNDESVSMSEDNTSNNYDELKTLVIGDISKTLGHYSSAVTASSYTPVQDIQPLSADHPSENIDLSMTDSSVPGHILFSAIMDSSRMDVVRVMQSVIPSLAGVSVSKIDADNTGIEITGDFAGNRQDFVTLLRYHHIPVGD